MFRLWTKTLTLAFAVILVTAPLVLAQKGENTGGNSSGTASTDSSGSGHSAGDAESLARPGERGSMNDTGIAGNPAMTGRAGMRDNSGRSRPFRSSRRTGDTGAATDYSSGTASGGQSNLSDSNVPPRAPRY